MRDPRLKRGYPLLPTTILYVFTFGAAFLIVGRLVTLSKFNRW